MSYNGVLYMHFESEMFKIKERVICANSVVTN